LISKIQNTPPLGASILSRAFGASIQPPSALE